MHRERKDDRTHRRLHVSTPYLAALLIIAGVTGLILLFRSYLDTVDVLVFYLVAVTGIALITELKPSIAGAVAGFLAFNFFFTVPYHTFFVANTHDILALVAFLGLSIVISRLVVRARTRTREAIRHSQQTEMLYQLSIALIRANDLEAALTAIVERARHMFDLSTCTVLLAHGDAFRIGASVGELLDLSDQALLSVARWSLEHGDTAEIGTERVRGRPPADQRTPDSPACHEILLIPIATAEERIGILLVARKHNQRSFNEEESRLLVTVANQAALAIERSLLAEDRTRAEVLSRTDELRTALLSAVSHDLRTPLASIKASVTTLMQSGIDWSDEDRRDLLEAIDEEADRLTRLVANLLDLSRIEAGALKPSLAWYEPSEIISEVLERSDQLLNGHEVKVDLPARTILVDVDFVMISEVLANLVENAVKFSPPSAPIQISACKREDMLAFSVEDRGPGIPPGEEERIFDKFYRVELPRRTGGSGMGLAICRGFVEAHGGRIWVAPNHEGGATFTFTIPLADDAELAGEPLARETVVS
jgi:two-component system sensor histidine kinase KdpD